MMGSRAIVLLMLVVLVLSGSCSSPSQQERQREIQEWFQPNGKLKVLATTAMINDLVAEVGGEFVQSLTLITGQLDPHSYQLVKGDDEKLSRATLIFSNGLGLEHGPSLKDALRAHSGTVSLGDKIREAEPNLILTLQGQYDPHIWMDISLWKKNVPMIVEALSRADPAHAAEYRANGEALMKKMDQAHEEMRTLLQAIPEKSRYLVTSHDAFNYFTRAYLATDAEVAGNRWQNRFAAPEGLAPDSQLSTTDIQAILDHLKKYEIHVVFPECSVSRDSINKILQAGRELRLDVRIADVCLYSDAMGPPGSDGDTYLKMVTSNGKKIADHLNRSAGGSR